MQKQPTMTVSKINPAHDGSLDIATGRHRREANWKNKSILWSDLLVKLSTTHRTAESFSEYAAAKKPRQDEIKDIGGFVGGYLDKGKRRKSSVLNRQLITLDADFLAADSGLWDDFKLYYNNAACVYSTHKHEPDKPRLRLILPLDREVMPDEYIAIARRIAGSIGVELFDPTTYQPERLMYWPSTSKDGEFMFEYQDGPWLSADAILATYHDWRDSSEWPMSDREKAIPLRAIKKQGDPLEKTGIVGAFCRTYSISEAIDKFLNDVYEKCDVEDRYSYLSGSTGAGLVVYEDKYAYSHHGTDPISGKLCNSFDLVRLHKYGLKDEDSREGTAGNKLPSFTEMVAFATKDKAVKVQLGSERISEATDDFADDPLNITGVEVKEDNTWCGEMDVDGRGKYLSTVNNVLLILQNDPELKGCFALDIFEHREIALKNLPWRKITHQTRYLTDKDDSGIRYHIEKKWGISGQQKIEDGMAMLMLKNSFHPIKDYLEAQTWDGEERAETIFIDYLGAKDSEYTRTAARKWLAAAVTRIYRPGCKFDYTPILIGKQGQKKSMLADKLGRQWYSDSFTTVTGKEAFEQLQGAWIIEIPELSGFKKADAEAVKHYMSKREDRYRVAYGRRVENFPRQSVPIGTGNIENFIKDPTGGRRFWPVITYQQQPIKDVAKDLTEEEIGQIWAEAMTYYYNEEPLYFDAELEKVANDIQETHSEQDPRTGQVEEYLEILLPDNWDSMDVYRRREWLRPDDELSPSGTRRRTHISIAEIWCEVMGGTVKDMTTHNTKYLHDIMRKMKGWQPAKVPKRFKFYGTQRVYERVNTSRKNGVNTSGKTLTQN